LNGCETLVIEHNLDLAWSCDWVIDLSPEGGEAGGYIVAQGTPEDITQEAASGTGSLLNGRA